MMIVHRIPARHEGSRKRVAAYCRVSTLSEAQEESFEAQVDYYTRLIQGNPDWTLARIYADQGMSGTSARKRPRFMDMIQDARRGEMDIILVKSISRFSRNIVDCQSYVAELKDRGVEVRFEREGISSFDSTSDFIFSLLSAVAQDESRSISENVKWGYRNRFERGEFCLGNNRVLGYDTDPKSKKLAPNGDAWIVRRAFELFVQGRTYQQIAGELNANGARGLRSRAPIGASAVRYIIGNETYAGDKRLQKSPPVDFLSGKPDRAAQYESYYMRDEHEAIVDRATWEAAQAILMHRRDEAGRGIHKRGVKHHPFYGKAFCGECGAAYTRRTFTMRTKAGAERYHAWNCRERQKGSAGNGCRGRTIREAALERAICDHMLWEAFDAERFEHEVERVVITHKGIEVFRAHGVT